MNRIHYRDGYKYQLAEAYRSEIRLILSNTITTEFINLHAGLLLVKRGYAWDGPSGLTIDTADSMRGFLERDALYQLMRMELLHPSYRIFADRRLKEVCLEDGMPSFRAEYIYQFVQALGESSSLPENFKEVFVAPLYDEDESF